MLNIDVRRLTDISPLGHNCLLGMLNIDVRRHFLSINNLIISLLGMLNIDVRRLNQYNLEPN